MLRAQSQTIEIIFICIMGTATRAKIVRTTFIVQKQMRSFISCSAVQDGRGRASASRCAVGGGFCRQPIYPSINLLLLYLPSDLGGGTTKSMETLSVPRTR
jgi:hypothetical protein